MDATKQNQDQQIKPAGLPDHLPIDPTTRQPLPPRAQPGYYPGFNTLAQQNFWDETTRRVVQERVYNVPPIRFFNTQELHLMWAVTNRILPQDDRDQAHQIPIVNYIDARLYSNKIDGYRYEDMPPDQEAHRLGLVAIEAIAQHLHQQPFVELGPRQQDEVLKTIHDGKPPSAPEIWQRMSVLRYWQLLVQDAIEGYYSHPFAWDEIGFGGPAYPRGYMRQQNGEPEPWEVAEERYAWDAPPNSLSGEYSPIGGQGNQQTHQGQEGTH